MSAPQDLQVNNLCISSTADVSSYYTGSLTVAGGTSITKGLWVSGTLQVRSSSDFYADLTVFGNRSVFVATTDSTSVGTGTLITNGGIGVAKNISIGANLFVGGTCLVTGNTTLTGGVLVNSAVNATSPTTGSVVIAGGVGVGSDMYLGGNLFSGGATFAQNVTIQGSISAGSATYGSMTVTGNTTLSGTTTLGGLDVGSLNLSGALFNCNNGVLDVSTTETRFATLGESGEYFNSLSLFTYGASFTDRNFEALQVSSQGNAYVISSRSLGLGSQRDISLKNGYTSLTLTGDTITIQGNTTITGVTSVKSLVCSNLSFSPFATAGVDPDTKQTVYTSPNGYRWEGMNLDNSGNLNVQGNLSCGELTLATSTKSINFIFDGSQTGLSFGDKTLVYEGDEWYFGKGVLGVANRTFAIGYIDLQGTPITSLVLDNSQGVTVTSTSESTDYTTGALIVHGGVGVAKSVVIGGNLTVTGNITGNLLDSVSAKLLDTTDSTSVGSGAVIVAGGMSVAKKLNCTSLASSSAQLGGLTVSGTSISSTGDLVLEAGNVTVGLLTVNKVVASELDCTTFHWNPTQAQEFPAGIHVLSNCSVTGSTTLTGDASITGNLTCHDLTCADMTMANLTISSTTPSTSPMTGCLVLQGGLGVRDSVHVSRNLGVVGNASITGGISCNGQILSFSMNDSTNYTNGALTLYGGVGIGKSLCVGGNITCTGDANIEGDLFAKGQLVSASDIRLKYDIRPLEDTIAKVKKILPRRFKMKSTSEDDLGFIAQNVEEVFPELVHSNKDGYKYLDYAKMTSVLMSALQEVILRVETLERQA